MPDTSFLTSLLLAHFVVGLSFWAAPTLLLSIADRPQPVAGACPLEFEEALTSIPRARGFWVAELLLWSSFRGDNTTSKTTHRGLSFARSSGHEVPTLLLSLAKRRHAGTWQSQASIVLRLWLHTRLRGSEGPLSQGCTANAGGLA